MPIYDVVGSLEANLSRAEICENFVLTDTQLNTALDYIAANRAEVEAEYQEIIQSAEAERQCWEERNCERLGYLFLLHRFNISASTSSVQ
jgi:hypothetical protein